MKTERLYYFSDTFTARATVLKLTSNGTGGIVVLDRTIFCVQGGGQPADTGAIEGINVTHVEAPKESPDIILHTVACFDGLTEGAEVNLQIDVRRRRFHSRLHTGGHLLAALVEEVLPGAKACGGHHWPEEGRVEFNFDGVLPGEFEQILADAIVNAIDTDYAVQRTLSPIGERYVQIGGYSALRCGGTHCERVGEIGSLALRGIKHKKGRLRIGYDIDESWTG